MGETPTNRHSQLGLKTVLADLLPALSMASAVSLLPPEDGTSGESDRPATYRSADLVREIQRRQSFAAIPVPDEDESSHTPKDEFSSRQVSASEGVPNPTEMPGRSASMSAASGPNSSNNSGKNNMRRRASASTPSLKSPLGPEDMLHLPPRSTSGRRPSYVLNYLTSARRKSATTPDITQPVEGEVESASTPSDRLTEFLNSAGMAELVDAAMVGLLRVVSRFQVLFDAAGEESSQLNESTRSDEPLASNRSRRQSSFGSTSDPIRPGSMSLLHTVTDTARAGRRPSTFAKSVFFPPVEGDEEASTPDKKAAAESKSVTVTLSKDDLDALTCLTDVLTVAWSGGIWNSGPTPASAPTATAAGSSTAPVSGSAADTTADVSAPVATEGEVTEALPSRSHSATPMAHMASSRRSSQSDFDAALQTMSLSGAPLTVAAVGGLLRRASAVVGGDIGLLHMLQHNQRAFAAIPEAESTTPRENSQSTATAPAAGLRGPGTHDSIALEHNPSTADNNSAADEGVPRTARRNSVVGGVSIRHRSTRNMAKEELQRSFNANPQIFDESTKEYVASLVSPQPVNKPRTAKERLRAGVAKVVRVAQIARRLSALAGTKVPIVLPTLPDEAGAADSTTGTEHTATLADHRSKLGAFAPVLKKISLLDGATLFRDAHLWDFDVIRANELLLQRLGLTSSEHSSSGDSAASDHKAAVTHTSAELPPLPPPHPGTRASKAEAPALPDPIHHVVEHVEGHTDTHSADSSPTAGLEKFGAIDARLRSTGSDASTKACRGFKDIPDSGNGLGAEMLVSLTLFALERTCLEELGIDKEKCITFFGRIAKAYHNQPYHNALHGADVTQAMYSLLVAGGLGARLKVEHRCAALIAAAVHDVGHPGFNNIYLTQTQHPLALTYNDRSPLENMHAATAFLSMRKPGCDILSGLTADQRNDMRATIIDMILATDNAHHFKLIGKIRRRLARAMRARDSEGGEDDYTSSDDGLDAASETSTTIVQPLDMNKSSDSRLVLQTILHACDISNPARMWEVCSKWTDRITEEFLIQGDKLRELGLPVLPMNDRLKPIPRPNMQAGFISALVLPLWNHLAEPAFAQIMDVTPVLEGLHENLDRYKDMIEKAKAAT